MIANKLTIRNIHYFTAVTFYSVVLFLFAGCASAPVQEMSDARQAIQAAKEAGASAETQPNLQKAENLLKEAESALENGEYKKAKLTATEARNEALKAQKTIVNGAPPAQ